MSILNTTTSDNRPSNPTLGSLFFETDTSKMILWDGSAWSEYGSDSEASAGEWIIVTPPAVNSIYNGTANTLVSYGVWLYSIDNTKLGKHVWDSATTVSASNNGMEAFHTGEDVLIDAIRVRCTRPIAGAGSFGFFNLCLAKSSDTSLHATNPAGFGARGFTRSGMHNLDLVSGDSSQAALNDGTTGQVSSYLQNIILENDPRGLEDTVPAGTSYFKDTSGNFNDPSTTTSSAPTTWSGFTSGSYSWPQHYRTHNRRFGIYGGSTFPIDPFFTLFFSHPLNLKDLNCIDFRPWEEPNRTNLNISFEFRKA